MCRSPRFSKDGSANEKRLGSFRAVLVSGGQPGDQVNRCATIALPAMQVPLRCAQSLMTQQIGDLTLRQSSPMRHAADRVAQVVNPNADQSACPGKWKPNAIHRRDRPVSPNPRTDGVTPLTLGDQYERSLGQIDDLRPRLAVRQAQDTGIEVHPFHPYGRRSGALTLGVLARAVNGSTPFPFLKFPNRVQDAPAYL